MDGSGSRRFVKVYTGRPPDRFYNVSNVYNCRRAVRRVVLGMFVSAVHVALV